MIIAVKLEITVSQRGETSVPILPFEAVNWIKGMMAKGSWKASTTWLSTSK